MTAERFCGRLIEHAESLAEFPLQGRVVPEKQRTTLREIILSPSRIAYEIQSDRNLVEIMTIWHAARGPIEF
jgi:plasmid stabilization system protein ParE